jgi:ribosomal-protein-alanine N-acetyltransferase
MFIECERLTLKEISFSDLENIHELYSYPEVDEYNTLGIPKDLAATKEIIKSFIEDQTTKPRKSYHWKIVIKDNNEFIGLCGLIPSNDLYKLGELYYKLIPPSWGKGYATEISKNIVRFGFDKLKLHKIEADVATENYDSIKVLEKLGMTKEGLRRKLLPIRGEWKDCYHYAIVEDDLIK